MKKSPYTLIVNGERWELKRLMLAEELMELSSELYWEGLHGEASWWLQRWHEGSYLDTEAQGLTCDIYTYQHASMVGLRNRLTPSQIKQIQTETGQFEIELPAPKEETSCTYWN